MLWQRQLVIRQGHVICRRKMRFSATRYSFRNNNSFSSFARLNQFLPKNNSVGEVREWPIRTVSKTVVPQGTVGSNPTLSANLCLANS